NRADAGRIGTSDAMTVVLLQLLLEAGYRPDNLILLEHGSEDVLPAVTRRPDLRWQGAVVNFGRSGRDSFVAALDQATAILNVPFLKTHRLAATTGCLKNLSHGLIRHPARFHGGGCDPAIAEIVASSPLKAKVKLHIVNGLRAVI